MKIIIAWIMSLIVIGGIVTIEAKALTRVFKGKDNWLFYSAEGDGTTIADYKGINHYSKLGLKRVEDNLLSAKNKVNSQGAEFVLFLAPNKETIYSQYMPKSIHRKTKYTRLDQLYDYLSLNTTIDVAYPKKELIKRRKSHQLYHKNDTHWNRQGQFIGTQELLNVTDCKMLSIDKVKFKEKKNYYGDLNRMSNGRYTNPSTAYLFASKVKAKDKSNKTVFIVGDSFGNCMSKVCKRYYKKVTFCHVNNFRMSMTDGYDVVVWEVVERYQDKLARINLANR